MLTISGCGALAIARLDNLNQALAVLFIGCIGIGGIIILPAVVSTIICPDVSLRSSTDTKYVHPRSTTIPKLQLRQK